MNEAVIYQTTIGFRRDIRILQIGSEDPESAFLSVLGLPVIRLLEKGLPSCLRTRQPSAPGDLGEMRIQDSRPFGYQSGDTNKGRGWVT